MANIKSQIKRNRQNEKRRLRNRNFRGAARTAVKGAQTTIAEGGEESKAAVLAAIGQLDRAAKQGAIHPRNASRRKSRLMKRLNKSATAAATPKPAATKKAAAKKAPANKTAAKKATK